MGPLSWFFLSFIMIWLLLSSVVFSSSIILKPTNKNIKLQPSASFFKVSF